jgi:MoaA/NifB/PqqE/SkfB family radical SAM enzyme
MKNLQAFPDLTRAFLQYLRLRRKKGLLGVDFLVRSLRFNILRMLSSQRMTADSPLVTTMAITSKCALDCYHCSEGYKKNHELPLQVVLDTIDQVVEAGCPAIALTGGEPFMRREILEIIDRIPMSVIKVIYTSGIGLDHELAAELNRRWNILACFSIDRPDPDEHDRLRGRKGSYEAAMRGIELLSRGRVELHVSTITTRPLVLSGELVGFTRMLRKKGVACMQFFQPRPVGRLEYGLDLFLRPEDEQKLIETVRDILLDPEAPLVLSYPSIERVEAMGCCGGYARVCIDSHGHVCPCDFLPLSFGLLTEEPFPVIWKRMRGFYDHPGSRCQVRDNPEVFNVEREGRNVDFTDVSDRESLRSESPGLFERMGESAYRTLLANLIIASIATTEPGARRGHE